MIDVEGNILIINIKKLISDLNYFLASEKKSLAK
jgi:hypothetical protein